MTMYREPGATYIPQPQERPKVGLQEALAAIAQAYVSLRPIHAQGGVVRVDTFLQDDLFGHKMFDGSPELQAELSNLYALAKVIALYNSAQLVASPGVENKVSVVIVNGKDRDMLVNYGLTQEQDTNGATARLSFDPTNEELLEVMSTDFSARMDAVQQA
jgi:hypothetical protein